MASAPFLSEVNDVEQKTAQWFAVYTNSRHEKVVARQLQDRSIETFLPLYRTWHRWKDRRKLVELPLSLATCSCGSRRRSGFSYSRFREW